MKISCFTLLVVIAALGVDGQRRSQPRIVADVEPSQKPISRGRTRFALTKEFEDITDNIKSASEVLTTKSEVPRRRSESQKRLNKRPYEVQEHIDDIPNKDNHRRFHSKPRVITETRFEAKTIPTKDLLFTPSTTAVPTETTSKITTSTVTTAKTSSENVEKDRMEDSAEAADTHSMSVMNMLEKVPHKNMDLAEIMQTSTESDLRRMHARTRVSTTHETPVTYRSRSRLPPRRQEESKSTPTPAPTRSRASRVRGGRRYPAESEPLPTQKTRGPSVFSQENLDISRSRTGRRVASNSRNKQTEATPERFTLDLDYANNKHRSSESSETTTEKHPEMRRFQDFESGKIKDAPESDNVVVPTKLPTIKSRVVPKSPVKLSSRYRAETTEPPRTRTTTKPTTRDGARNTNRDRARSRHAQYKLLTSQENLEVLPLFEGETKSLKHSPTTTPRTPRSRNSHDLHASSTVEVKYTARISRQTTPKPVRVSRRQTTPLESTSTRPEITTSRGRKPVIKESVEVSQVQEVTKRKVVRRKKPRVNNNNNVVPEPAFVQKVKVDEPRVSVTQVVTTSRGSKKAEFKQPGAKGKLTSSEEEIDESDNYPEPFKALIQAKKGKNKGSRSKSNNEDTKSSSGSTEKIATTFSTSPSTTASTTTSPLTTSGTTTKPSTVSLIRNEEAENELEPKTTTVVPSHNRPTRRRFSLTTKHPEETIQKTKSIYRDEQNPKPTTINRKKLLKTTVPPTIQGDFGDSATTKAKFHAKFNSATKTEDVHPTVPPKIHRGGFSPKPNRGTYNLKKGQQKPTSLDPERHVHKQKQTDTNKQVPPVLPPVAAKKPVNRFSARYRSEILPRVTGLKPTGTPAYIPTVPTVTPPAPTAPVRVEENELGMEIITFDDPVNTVPSANLISGEYLSSSSTEKTQPTVPLTTVVTKSYSSTVGVSSSASVKVPKESSTAHAKPVSIIEQIINSISAIPTTTPPDPTKLTIGAHEPTKGSAILKITKKPQFVEKTPKLTPKQMTTEKSTTVIEKILSSLSAIKAETTTDVQVGTTFNDISERTHKSSVRVTKSTTPYSISSSSYLPAHSSTTVDPLTVPDGADEQSLQKRTIGKLLALLNALSPTTTTQKPTTTKLVVVTPKATNFLAPNSLSTARKIESTTVPTLYTSPQPNPTSLADTIQTTMNAIMQFMTSAIGANQNTNKTPNSYGTTQTPKPKSNSYQVPLMSVTTLPSDPITVPQNNQQNTMVSTTPNSETGTVPQPLSITVAANSITNMNPTMFSMNENPTMMPEKVESNTNPPTMMPMSENPTVATMGSNPSTTPMGVNPTTTPMTPSQMGDSTKNPVTNPEMLANSMMDSTTPTNPTVAVRISNANPTMATTTIAPQSEITMSMKSENPTTGVGSTVTTPMSNTMIMTTPMGDVMVSTTPSPTIMTTMTPNKISTVMSTTPQSPTTGGTVTMMSTPNSMTTMMAMITNPPATATPQPNPLKIVSSGTTAEMGTNTPEPNTDTPSTMPTLQNFEVSPGSVKVFSANDLLNTNTVDDVGTTIFITTNRAPFISSSPVPTDPTPPKDISSNIIDTAGSVSDKNDTALKQNISPEPIQNDLQQLTTTTTTPKPRDKDYYIFAVLPNNTVLRKRPSMYPTKETPFLITAILPNNTVVRKFPNGTLVPKEPIIRVLGFDTRENPPPLPDITSNQVTQEQAGRPDNKNLPTDTVPPPVEANPLNIDGTGKNTVGTTTTNSPTNNNNTTGSSSSANTTSTTTTTSSTTTTSTTTTTTTTTTQAPSTNPTLPTLSDLLGGKTVQAFNNLVNQTQGGSKEPPSPPPPPAQPKTLQADPMTQKVNAVPPQPPKGPPTTTMVVTMMMTTAAPPTMVPRTSKQETMVVTTIKPQTVPPTTKPTPPPTTKPPSTPPPTTMPVPRPFRTTTSFPSTTFFPTFFTTLLSTLQPRVRYSTTPTTVSTTKEPLTTAQSHLSYTTTLPPSTMRTVNIRSRGSSPLYESFSTTTPSTYTTVKRRIPTTTFDTTVQTTNQPQRRRKTKTTTLPTTTTTKTTTTIITTEPPTTVSGTTIKVPDSLKDLNLKGKKLTEDQKKDIETLSKLEKEQAAILQQLAFLTKLNLGGNSKAPTLGPNNLANRIIALAMERDKTTAPPPTTTINILEALSASNTRESKNLATSQGKTPSIEDIVKQLSVNNLNSVTPSISISSTYGKSQDAILASILKEQGIGPTTPKSLGERIKLSGIFEQTVPPPTRRPTTQRPPGRLMQGLSWLFNRFTQPQQRPKPRPKPKKRPSDEEELLTRQPTHITPVVDSVPVQTQASNSLSDQEVQTLIKQLEAIQKDPKKAQNLDLKALKDLQKNAKKTNQDLDAGVQIITPGNNGATSRGTIRPRGRKSTTTQPSTVTNSLDDFDLTEKPRVSLPPVKLNPVPGIPDEDPRVRGQLINAAVNVTKAISSFFGSAIQGAAHSFQSLLGSGSQQVGKYLSSNSNSSNRPG